MKRGSLLLSVFGCLFLSACAHPHCTINRTPAGENVPVLGTEFIQSIPGRPFDKCSVLAQVMLTSSVPKCIYYPSDWNTALKNQTASIGGNVAIAVSYESGLLFEPMELTYTGVHGMALSCSEDTLKAAGFKNMIVNVVTEKDMTSKYEFNRLKQGNEEHSRGVSF